MYKPRDNGHTPSPDAAPGVIGQQQQQEAPGPLVSHRVEGAPFKPAPPSRDAVAPAHLPAEPSRPLSLNLAVESNVKAAQKEAVLSYVKAKTSPQAETLGPANGTPPYRSPPTAPAKTPRPGFPANGNQTPPGGFPAHTAATASFTVRREMERQREEMEQIQQLRQVLDCLRGDTIPRLTRWFRSQCIETRLKVALPDDLASALQDGVVLCHLANHVRPRSVASIHVPSPAVPKLTVAKCRRNVENFIEACRRIGVPEVTLLLLRVV